MPVTIKAGQMGYKSPSSGEYVGINGVAERTTAEQIADVEAAGTAAVALVQTKADEVTAQLANASEVRNMIAGVFNSNKPYTAGQYVIQTVTVSGSSVNKLFRFKVDHPAGAWDDTEVIEIKLADDVAGLQNELNSLDFDTNIETLTLSWIGGKYINKSNNTITSGNENLYITNYIPIPIGMFKIDIEHINTFGSSWQVAFYTADKSFISGVSFSASNGNYSIVSIPTNAKFFIVAHYAVSSSVPVSNVIVTITRFKMIDEIKNAVTTLTEGFDVLAEEPDNLTLTFINQKRLNGSGAIVNASTSFSISKIDLDSFYFSKINISGLNLLTNDSSSIAFYDINDQAIEDAHYNVKNKSFTKDSIPSNAKYLYLSHYITEVYPTSSISVVVEHSELLEMINGVQSEIDGIKPLNDITHENVLKGASTFTDNQFVNELGTQVGNTNFCLIDGYFPVKPNTVYKIYRDEPPKYANSGHNWTFYDSEKNYISGSYVLGLTATSPSNAAYLRFGVYIQNTGSATHETFDPTDVIITENGVVCFNKPFNDQTIVRPSVSGLKWIGIGDSITEDNFRAAYHYHDYIKAELGLNFVNMGVSGVGYKAGGNNAFYNGVQNMATDADVITIFGGVNDVVLSDATIGTETDTGTDTICGCVNTTLDRIETLYPAHMPIGIISPLPCACVDTSVNLHPVQNPADDSCRMAQFVEQLALICKHRGIPFLDLFHQSNIRPWHQECNAKYFSCESAKTGDGLHPNGYGHRLFYRQIMDFVQKIVMQ